MKHRWYLFRRTFRTKRISIRWMAVWLVLGMVIVYNHETIAKWIESMLEVGGIQLIGHLFPETGQTYGSHWNAEDPTYKRLMADGWEKDRKQTIEDESTETAGETVTVAEEVVTQNTFTPPFIHEKLKDFDYLMKHFYSVHPTTTADQNLLDAERFLDMEMTIEKNGEVPQILIYHTHSQEEYADYPENPEATVVGVGARLKELLEEAGYQVVHDESQYDVVDGELDRNQAYTYALDGITGILQKHPSIEVVLDLHRDGVAEETRLVTEVNGKEMAQIMFFNGISQTPDGPIAYLPNPNREGNLAFSFQLQYLAAEQYPNLTRKIYLKGLRYNQHVRARTALIEVGAQTNTYAEALNAMEPLADIICRVLEGY